MTEPAFTALLQGVLDAMPDPAAMFCVGHHHLLVNARFQNHLPDWPALVQDPSQWLSDPDLSQVRTGLNGQNPFTVHLKLREQWQQVKCSPVVLPEARGWWLVVMVPLEESAAYLQAVLDNAPIGICLMDEHLRIQRINPKLAEGTIYSPEQYPGRRLQELFPQTFPRVQPLIQRVMDTGEPLPPIEFQGQYSSGGRPIHWRVNYFPVKGSDGTLLGVGSTTQNLTDRVEAMQALQDSQHFLQGITELVPAIITVRDLSTGRAIYANQHTARVLGRTVHELDQLGPEEVRALLHEEDQPRIYRHYQEVLSLAEGETREIQYRVKHKEGGWRWVQLVSTVFERHPDGSPRTSLTAGIDITLQKEAELALRNSEQQLQQITQAQQRFVSDASHEIKTPLSAIQGNLELLLRYTDLPREEKEDILRDSFRETLRLSRLVSDLLALTRGQLEGQWLEDDVDVQGLVQETVREFQRTAEHHVLKMEGVGSGMVTGDRGRLKQLLVILVGNALKYTPAGGQVTLTVKSCPDHVEVRVRDTGVGIPAADLERVFERFYRSDHSLLGQTAEGSGLGLSIARWIVEGHQGKIWLESQPGEGTTAVVRLPVPQPTAVT